MTETQQPMTTSTPEAPVSTKPKRTLSPEHIAALAAGRAKHNAAKKEKDPNAVHSASAPVVDKSALPVKRGSTPVLTPSAEVEAMKAEIAALKKQLGGMTPEEVASLPTEECYYEFTADKRTDRGEPIGERITDPADPRIDEMIRDRCIVIGHIIVKTLVRAKSGEIIDRIDKTCVPARTPQAARSIMEARAKNPTGQWY